MNKKDIERLYGSYINTNKLYDDMNEMFRNAGVRTSEKGICKILNEFFINKEALIKIFQRSNNYIGGLRIAVKRQFRREDSPNEVRQFINSFDRNMEVQKNMLKTKDENGNTISDSMKVGYKSISAKSIGKMKKEKAICEGFNPRSGYTLKSERQYADFHSALTRFGWEFGEYLSTDIEIDSSDENNPVFVRSGRKTSKSFNRLCTYYGIDKFNPTKKVTNHNGVREERTVYPYDTMFAKYSDLVAGGQRELYFILSLNPLDYLTMSVADNWQSCHHISRGGWKSGCESYMLDRYSIITFITDNIYGDIEKKSKIYRTMFHCDYMTNTCVESRIYPQGNDGALDLYEQFRTIFCDVMSPLLNVENRWNKISGVREIEKNIINTGTHYKDLRSHEQCLVFWPKENKRSEEAIVIGHDCICPDCGEEHTITGRFNCYNC